MIETVLFALGVAVGIPLGAAGTVLLTGMQLWVRMMRGERP